MEQFGSGHWWCTQPELFRTLDWLKLDPQGSISSWTSLLYLRPCHVGWPQDKVTQGKHKVNIFVHSQQGETFILTCGFNNVSIDGDRILHERPRPVITYQQILILIFSILTYCIGKSGVSAHCVDMHGLPIAIVSTVINQPLLIIIRKTKWCSFNTWRLFILHNWQTWIWQI